MSVAILLHIAFLPVFAFAQAAPQETSSNQLYNGGDDNPVDPSTAGAEGSSKGAFSLSKGAIAAIITVAVLVAVGGSKSLCIASQSSSS